MTQVFLAPIDFNKDTNMKFTIFVLLYTIKKSQRSFFDFFYLLLVLWVT